ncbi:OmpA family protein [Algoriphagus aestuarii]|nr:OmpA family protein [Algoriphagus aestuarii]
MKKFLLAITFLFSLGTSAFAQSKFKKWSLEGSYGFNKPMGPLTQGYYSPTLNLGHVDFGIRYMFNNKYGIKGKAGFGSFSEAKDRSPEFNSNYVNVSFEGIVNLGRVLNFESFSKRLGLLGYFGPGFGYLKQDSRPIGDFDPDYVYSFNSGISLLFKVSNSIALTWNPSIIVNGRQRYTFDGNEFISPGRPEAPEIPYVHATGTWWTGTIGLNFYLGTAESHADWYIESDKYATKEELATQINGIKDMLKDSDGDGVPDYLDKEPNTPIGARVNSHGTTMDSDGDGTPDHMDNCPFVPGPASTNGCPVQEIKQEVDFFKKAINDGYVNVYFAFDSAKPLGYSIPAANYVANFLKKNPGVVIEIKGYADELGSENYNIKLSEKRAKTIYDLLISTGIDASKLTYKGYGEDTSVDKSSPDARQMARRTSFEVK